jgi:hypothetical protein
MHKRLGISLGIAAMLGAAILSLGASSIALTPSPARVKSSIGGSDLTFAQIQQEATAADRGQIPTVTASAPVTPYCTTQYPGGTSYMCLIAGSGTEAEITKLLQTEVNRQAPEE